MEFLQQRIHFKAFLNGAIISKCFRARLWDNSKFVARQIDKIGPTLASALVNAGVITFQKIEETNPRELELVCTLFFLFFLFCFVFFPPECQQV